MGMTTLKAQAEGKYGAVTVAILDTGIDRSNFMFQSRTISPQSYNFIDANKNVSDNHGHGTHVAGIIADSTPSNVQFLILKISNSSGYSSLLTIKTALQYALNRNVSAVNMSLGFVGVNAMSITYLDFPHQQGVPKRNRHQLRFRQQRGGCLLLLSGMQQQDAGSLLLRAE